MVLELTLKHVKALSTLLEQQQQKIIALQKDLQISKLIVKHCWRALHRLLHPSVTSTSGINCAAEVILKNVFC